MARPDLVVLHLGFECFQITVHHYVSRCMTKAALANQGATRAAALADLASFKTYGALFADDRKGGLNAIRAEACRMQERVTFEKEIRLAMQQKETEERDPDDPEEDVQDPDEW